MRSSYEERLLKATAREAELLILIQRQRSDSTRSIIDTQADLYARSTTRVSDYAIRQRNDNRTSGKQIVATPTDNNKVEVQSERISSEDIMRGLSSLNIDS